MYTKESVAELFKKVAESIDISEDMFDKAEKEYNDLGNWIDKKTPDYRIAIYPQGSFALGTVVRPISNEDDYDIDLVCQLKSNYGLDAKALKVDLIRPLLMEYRKGNNDIIEKRRCWHVEYEEIPNFHMDVIPAYLSTNNIFITDHNEENDTYEYIGSNPSGYIEWFFDRCAKQRERLYENYVKEHHLIVSQADIEKLKRRKVKTPLQRAVQLLKRHRDIVFENLDESEKPISIIITTIAGQLYNEEDDIYDALSSILGNAISYINSTKCQGQFYIENPSYSGENFADKWNSHPERANAFYNWIEQARSDLLDTNTLTYNRIEMANHISNVFGEDTCKRVYRKMAKEDQNAIKQNRLKVDTKSGILSSAGTIGIPKNHHHGR